MDETDEMEQLRSRLGSAQRSLASATEGYKKTRRMRGADAHKRMWYFEEQVQKWSAVVDSVQAEIDAKVGSDSPPQG
jgi:hypothetical protein